jgi:RNA-directed DNA polymerase
MGKRQERGVDQLVLAIEPWDEEPSNQASLAEVVPPAASTDAASLETVGSRKQYTLYDKVCKEYTLWHSWLRVEGNKGAPGTDGMTIAEVQGDAHGFLRQLRRELREKRYRPRPVRRCTIDKDGGGERHLGIPCVRDRIVQTAVVRILEPIFEAKFSEWSHGYRPGRGCATALALVDRAVQHGYEWIVDADIKSFFDTVDHQKVLCAVNEEVADGSVLRLIEMFLKADVMADEARIEVEEGTPQGGPISSLLANIYLHPLDTALHGSGYGFVRYADDFVVFARTKEEAQKALALIQETVAQLGLQLNAKKTRIAHISDGFSFLGFRYFRTPKGTYKLVREKSESKFREAVRWRTKRHAGQKPRKAKACTAVRLRRDERLMRMIASVNEYLRSWHVYFRHGWPYYVKRFEEQDAFVRRRIRCAIAGRYVKGRWNSHILPNQRLTELGLVTLEQLQRQYHRDRRLASPTSG